MYYFIFCKTDILLQKLEDGTYTIPCCEDPPIEVKPPTALTPFRVASSLPSA